MAGCSKPYRQQRLGLDSAQAKEVSAMIAALREAGRARLPDLLGKQAVSGLDDDQLQGLTAALGELVEAPSVELVRVDAFGPNLYRATFRLDSQKNPRSVAFLVVEEAGRLRWAGTN